MTLTILNNIPFLPSDNPRLALDLYLPSSSCSSYSHPPLLVFIHGGAWRSNSRSDYVTLASRLAITTHLPVAVPGYRLSVPAHDSLRPIHPSHQQDIEHSLVFLASVASIYGYSTTSTSTGGGIILIGHSVGAHITSRILLSPLSVTSSTSINIIGMVGIDGIFDINALVQEYPQYMDFVQQGVGDNQLDWDRASVTYYLTSSTPSPDLKSSHYPGILLVHSPDDELLSTRQPNLFYQALVQFNQRNKVFSCIERDYSSVSGNHDQLLNEWPIVNVISQFVTRIQSNYKLDLS